MTKFSESVPQKNGEKPSARVCGHAGRGLGPKVAEALDEGLAPHKHLFISNISSSKRENLENWKKETDPSVDIQDERCKGERKEGRLWYEKMFSRITKSSSQEINPE